EEAAQIVAKSRGRGVSPLRVARQRLEQDGVEVAAQLPLEPPKLTPTGAGRGAATRLRRRAWHALSGELRRQGGARAPRAPVRERAHQQLVEHDAERVDVGGGGHRLAEDLLRGGV